MLFDESKFQTMSPKKGNGVALGEVTGTKKKSKTKVEVPTQAVSTNGENSTTKRKKGDKKGESAEENPPAKKSKAKDKLTATKKGRKQENNQVEDRSEPPRKKKKKGAEKEVKVIVEIPALECPGDSFYDVSYSAKRHLDSGSELSGDESETTVAKSKVKNRKKKKGKRTEEVEPEIRVETKEAKAGDPINSATSVDDFEKLLLTSPNSSKVWCAYMTFVLQVS